MAGDRDPVAVVKPMVGILEAAVGEQGMGKRSVGAAGLLEQDDIRVVTIEDVHQVIEARPDRVDVPAHDSHRRGRYRSGQVRSGRVGSADCRTPLRGFHRRRHRRVAVRNDDVKDERRGCM